jgi:hypothetical protein
MTTFHFEDILTNNISRNVFGANNSIIINSSRVFAIEVIISIISMVFANYVTTS